MLPGLVGSVAQKTGFGFRKILSVLCWAFGLDGSGLRFKV